MGQIHRHRRQGRPHAFHQAASLTLVVSPSSRQSGEFLRKAAAFARKLGIRPKGDGDNQVSSAFPNGSRIVGLPATEATNRGFSAVSLLLIDEAARVSDQLYMSLRPMLAVSAGSLWLMSTPFGKQGFFYETWVQGGPEWVHIRAPATACPRIPPAFLAEERATMGERCFRQEYLCEFEDSVAGVFQRDLLESAAEAGVGGGVGEGALQLPAPPRRHTKRTQSHFRTVRIVGDRLRVSPPLRISLPVPGFAADEHG